MADNQDIQAIAGGFPKSHLSAHFQQMNMKPALQH